MWEILFKIWYMIAVLPFFVVLEGQEWLKKFMKKRGWDWTWPHLFVALLVILLIVLLLNGYR